MITHFQIGQGVYPVVHDAAACINGISILDILVARGADTNARNNVGSKRLIKVSWTLFWDAGW